MTHPANRTNQLRQLYRLYQPKQLEQATQPPTRLLISVSSSCLLILVLISARSPGIQVPRMAEGFAHYPKKNAGLYELMQRVEQKRDPLLMKVKGPW